MAQAAPEGQAGAVGAQVSQCRAALSGQLSVTPEVVMSIASSFTPPISFTLDFLKAALAATGTAHVAISAVASILRAGCAALDHPAARDACTANVILFMAAALRGLCSSPSLDVPSTLHKALAEQGSGLPAWTRQTLTHVQALLDAAHTGQVKDACLALLLLLAVLEVAPEAGLVQHELRRTAPALGTSLCNAAHSRVTQPGQHDLSTLLALLAFRRRAAGTGADWAHFLQGKGGEGSAPPPSLTLAPLTLATFHTLMSDIAAAAPEGSVALRSIVEALDGSGYEVPLTPAALASTPTSALTSLWTSSGHALGAATSALGTAVAYAVGVGAPSTAPAPSAGGIGFNPVTLAQSGAVLASRGATLLVGPHSPLLGHGRSRWSADQGMPPLPLTHVARVCALLLHAWDVYLSSVGGMRVLAGVARWRGGSPPAAPPLLKALLTLCSYATQTWDDAAASLGLVVLQRLTEGLQHLHMARRSRARAARRTARRAARAAQAHTAASRDTAVAELQEFKTDADPLQDRASAVREGPPAAEAEFASCTALLAAGLAESSCSVVLFRRGDVPPSLRGSSPHPAATATQNTLLVPHAVSCRALLQAATGTACACLRLQLRSKHLCLAVLHRALKVLHRALYLVAHTVPERASARPRPPQRQAEAGGGGSRSQAASRAPVPAPEAAPSPPATATTLWPMQFDANAAWGAVTGAVRSVMGPSNGGAASLPASQTEAARTAAAHVQAARAEPAPQAPPPAESRQQTLSPAFAALMRHVDWLEVCRSALSTCKCVAALDLWRAGKAGSSLQGESRAVAQLAALVLDMTLTVLRGPARVEVYYDMLRCEGDLGKVLAYWAAVDAAGQTGGEGQAAGEWTTLPPRLGTCCRNLQGVLAALGGVPSRAAMLQAAQGSMDDALQEASLKRAIALEEPWGGIKGRSDKTMDAYTPLAEVSEGALFQGLAKSLTADVRRCMHMA